MTDDYERLQRFFSNIGFSVVRSERFDSFGDYIIEACSPYFCVKGVSDRGIESIEFRSLVESNWFAANVVMSYVLQKDLLMDESTLDIQTRFLEKHLDDLAVMFNEDNYKKTRTILHEMELERGRILFPRWFP